MKFLNKIKLGVALSCVGLFSSGIGYGQTESTLSFIDNVYQSSYYSPFNRSDFNLSIGLPVVSSVYANAQHSGFAVADFYPNGIDKPLDPGAVIDQMRKNEFVNTDLQVDLFHFYWQYGKQAFSFHVKDNVSARFTYPKDMLDLAWRGNGAFVGDEIDFSGLGFAFQHYREYAVGFSRTYDKWFFTARGKLLLGKSAANFKANDLRIKISDDVYQHTFIGDLEANYGGFDFEKFDAQNADEQALAKEYALNAANKGLGLDLAASYEFNTKLQVNAALTNVGFINWKEAANNVNLDEEESFIGVDAFDIIFKNDLDSLEKGFEELGDSLEKKYDQDYLNSISTKNSFRTSTPWNLSVGARYEFLRSTYAVGRMSIYNASGIRGALSLGVYHDFLRWLNVGVTNTITNRKLVNVGAGIVVKPGPFQIYAVTDFLTAAQFLRAKQVNVRVGMNLVFGKAAHPEKLTSVLD